MYKVKKDGKDFAILESPVYLRLLTNGTLGLAEKEDAEAIIMNDTIYHIAGRGAIGMEAEDVLLEFTDGAFYLNTQVAANSSAIDDIIISMIENK